MSEASVSSGRAGTEPAPPIRRWMVLMVTTFGMLVTGLDTTVANIALPTIQGELGFSAAELQWVINAYLLGFGGFLLLAGSAADLWGRKRLFVAGMVVFGVGSLVAGAAPSAVVLLAGRGLQGLGGAVLAATSLSILTTTFTDTAGRSKALAMWSALRTGGVALGFIIGGVITDALSWRWIFFINLPIAAVAIAGALLFVRESRDTTSARRLDVPGAVTITTALGLLIYALTNATDAGWASAQTVVLLTAAAVLLAGFVAIELRSPWPLVRLGIFHIRTLTVGNLGFFLASGGMYGTFIFSSLYVQKVLGYSPLQAGFALAPLTIGVIAGTATAQQLMRRLGVRATGIGGLTVGAIGALLLTRITVSGDYATEFLPGLFVLALGLGLSMVPFVMLATTRIAEHEAGLASGIYNSVAYIGGALGLAILSTIATSQISTASDTPTQTRLTAQVSGYHLAYLTAAALLVLGALLIATFLRRRHVADLEHGHNR